MKQFNQKQKNIQKFFPGLKTWDNLITPSKGGVLFAASRAAYAMVMIAIIAAIIGFIGGFAIKAGNEVGANWGLNNEWYFYNVPNGATYETLQKDLVDPENGFDEDAFNAQFDNDDPIKHGVIYAGPRPMPTTEERAKELGLVKVPNGWNYGHPYPKGVIKEK